MYNKRSWQNRCNNDQGQLFEKLIDQGCVHYRMKEIAMIEKTPEPFRVKKINGDGSMLVYPIGKAQPDYKGTLKGGKAIVFEAKRTAKDRISQSVITENQAVCLAMHAELGAVSGVCCMIQKVVAFIPWDIWRDMKEIYGRKYLLQKEILEFQVPTPGFIDFLHNVKKEIG